MEDVRTSIAAEVARDYLVVRVVQARLDLTRSTLAIARRTQALAREQERAGLVTEADTACTDAQVLAVETTVPQLELLELQARQRLATLAGREPSALAATLAPQRPIPVAQAQVAAGIPAELLLRRPDLRIAERQLAAATHAEAGAVRDLYPKLSLSGAAGTQADTVGSLFDWSSRFFRLTANLTAPIFDGGRRRGEIELQRGRVDAAAARYRRTVLTAFREVEEGLAALGRNSLRRDLAERTVGRRRKARAVLDEQYRAGLVGLLDVLTAERDLADAETLAVNARAQVTVDWIALQKALGGGWRVVPLPAPHTKENSRALVPQHRSLHRSLYAPRCWQPAPTRSTTSPRGRPSRPTPNWPRAMRPAARRWRAAAAAAARRQPVPPAACRPAWSVRPRAQALVARRVPCLLRVCRPRRGTGKQRRTERCRPGRWWRERRWRLGWRMSSRSALAGLPGLVRKTRQSIRMARQEFASRCIRRDRSP